MFLLLLLKFLDFFLLRLQFFFLGLHLLQFFLFKFLKPILQTKYSIGKTQVLSRRLFRNLGQQGCLPTLEFQFLFLQRHGTMGCPNAMTNFLFVRLVSRNRIRDLASIEIECMFVGGIVVPNQGVIIFQRWNGSVFRSIGNGVGSCRIGSGFRCVGCCSIRDCRLLFWDSRFLLVLTIHRHSIIMFLRITLLLNLRTRFRQFDTFPRFFLSFPMLRIILHHLCVHMQSEITIFGCEWRTDIVTIHTVRYSIQASRDSIQEPTT